jgi:hypothetical protein
MTYNFLIMVIFKEFYCSHNMGIIGIYPSQKGMMHILDTFDTLFLQDLQNKKPTNHSYNSGMDITKQWHTHLKITYQVPISCINTS